MRQSCLHIPGVQQPFLISAGDIATVRRERDAAKRPAHIPFPYDRLPFGFHVLYQVQLVDGAAQTLTEEGIARKPRYGRKINMRSARHRIAERRDELVNGLSIRGKILEVKSGR